MSATDRITAKRDGRPAPPSAASTPAIATFFAFAFAWSWGLGFAASQAGPGSDVARAGLFMAAGFGPSLAGFAAVAACGGRVGLEEWLARCLRWRIGWRYWAVAVLLPPAAMLVALALHGALGGAVPPSPAAGHVPLALANVALVFLVGGPLGEEFGWRGYALPALAARTNRRAASLIVGAIWGLWHLPLFFIPGTVQSQTPVALFMLSTLALSVILADLFWRSGESILPPLAMHTAINAFAGVFPTMPSGGDARAYALTVALLVVAAVVALWAEGRRARTRGEAGPPSMERASHGRS